MFKVLRGRIDQPGDPLRLSLAGEIIEGVTSLVERARTTGGQCYAALYELNDTELVQETARQPLRPYDTLQHRTSRRNQPPGVRRA